jgi:hypothetical protein
MKMGPFKAYVLKTRGSQTVFAQPLYMPRNSLGYLSLVVISPTSYFQTAGQRKNFLYTQSFFSVGRRPPPPPMVYLALILIPQRFLECENDQSKRRVVVMHRSVSS